MVATTTNLLFDLAIAFPCAVVGWALGTLLMDYILSQGLFRMKKEQVVPESDLGGRMRSMSATQARRMTAANLGGQSIAVQVNAIADAITLACRDGRSSVDPHLVLAKKKPTYYSKRKWLSAEHWDAIKKHFISLGYEWKDHPDPDPGHPASHAYTTIEW
jgi:hypothetical protein